MKFLRFVADYENQPDLWQPHASSPFPDFMTSQFHLSPTLQTSLLALTLSLEAPRKTTTEFALPRIARHLRSIGVFGPGFGAVLAKWGGGSEIAQVACRAGAVGGGVYVLGKGVEGIKLVSPELAESETQDEPAGRPLMEVSLSGGETVKTQWAVGTEDDIPSNTISVGIAPEQSEKSADIATACSITVVSSTLASLFPITAEGGPTPAGAVIVFPSGSLTASADKVDRDEEPPVYIIAHSSDTGECPSGQCVLYSSTSLAGQKGQASLDQAIERLLEHERDADVPKVLWSLRYIQSGLSPASPSVLAGDQQAPRNVLLFPHSSLDVVFDDGMINKVKEAWERIMGDDDTSSFMQFEEREGLGAEMSDDE